MAPLPSEQQVDLINSSWAKVVQIGLQPAGELFFGKLFDAHPEAVGLFTKFKDYASSQPYKEHALKVLQTVDKALSLLGDLGTLVPVLVRPLPARMYQLWPEPVSARRGPF
eukprot:COSAG04_NODE_2212_length_4519_cov_7.249887_2_plen_111_part_00